MALQENKAEPKAKPPEKAVPAPKGVQPESNGTGKVSAPASGVNSGSSADSNQTSKGDKVPPPSDGYGMYIFLGLLLGLFGYLWSKGHLQAFRKYVMETREQLRKCTWPTRNELYQHTVVVLLSTLMMGVFTVLADQAAALLVWDLLLDVKPSTSLFGKLFFPTPTDVFK